MNPIKFMEQYAKWIEEAKNEMMEQLNKTNGGYDSERDYFTEDGEVYSKHFNVTAGIKIPSKIQKTKYNFTVISWKDSKYYYEG